MGVFKELENFLACKSNTFRIKDALNKKTEPIYFMIPLIRRQGYICV